MGKGIYKKITRCKGCKYLHRRSLLMRILRYIIDFGTPLPADGHGSSDYRCDHPTNIMFVYRHSWLDFSRKRKWDRHPSQRNESNDCAWFDDK